MRSSLNLFCLSTFFKNLDCSYRRLDQKGLSTGFVIKTITLPTIMDCEQHCDRNKTCKSITYCNDGKDRNKCFLQSLQIQEFHPQEKTFGECITSYKPCNTGK